MRTSIQSPTRARWKKGLSALAAIALSTTLAAAALPPSAAMADDSTGSTSSESSTTVTQAQNPGFEQIDKSWLPTGWTSTGKIYATDAAPHSGKYALRLDQWNNNATLSQNVTEPAGTYDVSIYAWANESLGNTQLVVNGKQAQITSNGGTQIDGTKTWSQAVVEGVTVPKDGSLSISIVVPKLTSTTLEGYLDDVTIAKSSVDPSDTKPDSYITNNGFENGRTGWDLDGTIADKGHSGSKSLDQSAAGTHETSQKVTLAKAGSYTLTAYAQSAGTQDHAYLFARQGSTLVKAAIPRTTFPFDKKDAWTKVYLRGFSATAGPITLGVHSESSAAATLRIDDMHLDRDTQPTQFLQGGDISELTYAQDEGATYSDSDGTQRDPLAILAKKGWNFARIRIYNNPGKGRGNGSYYCPDGYLTVEDALRLARRAKKYGMQIELTFHYSDYWTNPGAQLIPAAWSKLIKGKSDAEAISILTQQINSFTADVLKKMAAQGTAPQYVSLGNETRSGMLLPYGSTSDWKSLAGMYNAGAKAVRQYDPGAKIIVHIDNGGDEKLYDTYFSNAVANNVDFDIIGASFYPHWMNMEGSAFTRFANAITAKFHKPIVIMESAANWNPTITSGEPGQLGTLGPYGDNSQSSPALQRQIMDDIFNAVKTVDNGYGLGVLYWDPVFVHAGGHIGWAISEASDLTQPNAVENTTLFDFDGKALPVMSTFDDNSSSSASAGLYGRVLDASGTPVEGVKVTAGTVDATTDRFGGYYLPLNAAPATASAAASTASGSSMTVTADGSADGLGTGTATLTYTSGRQSVADIRLTGSVRRLHVHGSVKDASGTPLASALVSIGESGAKYTAYTASDGTYTLSLPVSASGTLAASQNGYVTDSKKLGNATDQNIDFTLASDTGSVRVTVVDPDGTPISGARLTLSGRTDSAITAGDGTATLSDVPTGTAKLEAGKDRYLTISSDLVIHQGKTTTQRLTLPKSVALSNPGFEQADPSDGSKLVGWDVTANPTGSAVRQDRTGFGGAPEGTHALSLWDSSAFTATVSQKVAGLKAGTYYARLHVYSGINPKGLVIKALDDNGAELGRLETNTGMNDRYGFEFTLPSDGTVSLAIVANGRPGEWAVIDDVRLGYLGTHAQGKPDNPDDTGDAGHSGDSGTSEPGGPVVPTTPTTPATPSSGSGSGSSNSVTTGRTSSSHAAHSASRRTGHTPLAATGAGTLLIGMAAALTILSGAAVAAFSRRYHRGRVRQPRHARV